MTFPLGFTTDPGFDPAEDHIGPFYYKQMGDRRIYAFMAQDKHCNVVDVVHGGVLMTFADFSLCMEATDHYKEEDCVTVSFNCEFLSAARVGDLIECRANLTRKTGSLAFVTGAMRTGDEVLFTFSSVVKRLKRNQ